MQKELHPDYKKTLIKCACGAEFEVGSTKEEMSVEVCSQCHPFFTGKQRVMDAGGRIERFLAKYQDYERQDIPQEEEEVQTEAAEEEAEAEE